MNSVTQDQALACEHCDTDRALAAFAGTALVDHAARHRDSCDRCVRTGAPAAPVDPQLGALAQAVTWTAAELPIVLRLMARGCAQVLVALATLLAERARV